MVDCCFGMLKCISNYLRSDKGKFTLSSLLILDLRTLVAGGPIESVSLVRGVVGWLGGHLHSCKTALTIS